ncbi:MAG: 50S ribosomal protein L23 [Bacteroidales bacterium]|jgi:large subunit ribosomal protein L23|nr:50S ribosomal protein L23 [Bacteroidales bacterium]
MNIIIKPIITEKMTKMTEKFPNRLGFIVNKRANKIEIKKEIELLYGVRVDKVNTILYEGKNKTKYTKAGFINGKTNSFKKAIVELAKGDTIDFFSNI